MRLLRSGLSRHDVLPRIREIVSEMYARVPTGVGGHQRDARLSPRALGEALAGGAAWAVRHGFGDAADLERIEENGRLGWADPDLVSPRALERGQPQLGTLGSGNHFAELQYVDEIYDERVASAFGLARGEVTIMIHSGSRGLGHQVCEDHLRIMIAAARKYGIELPDRQLCCAPLGSPEARAYLGAMAAAANFAFANRQVMAHAVREVFASALGLPSGRATLATVYDVCHNIAKFETFQMGGRARRLCVHRKGATRAYPAGHRDTPAPYRAVGQPVLVPGDMGRYSYVLVGTPRALEHTFGSTCHGAGRLMSRAAAKRAARGRSLHAELEARGLIVKAAGVATIAEEMPEAYKDVADVVDVVHRSGISTKVARLRPLGVIKG